MSNKEENVFFFFFFFFFLTSVKIIFKIKIGGKSIKSTI